MFASRAQWQLLALLVCTLLLGACSSISYYSQSVIGHTRLMMARESIESVIPGAGPELARQLQLARELRNYSVRSLGLPDNDSYSTWVALDRDFPVWTVVAAPSYSLEARSWCYLVIGCASYRGYFQQQAAIDFAAGLQQEGFETSVGGAPAYSTLGWFDDPLLPSMMRYGDAQLAETLFHELAHQVAYINGASAFNEAFATVVGEQGVLRWLAGQQQEQYQNYRQKLLARDEFSLLIGEIKEQLKVLYESTAEEAELRTRKQALFGQLRANYSKLKQERWQGIGWFDSWFEQPVNNARLAAFSTYRELVPAFVRLLDDCDFDFPRFYQTVKQVKSQGESTAVPARCAHAP